MKKQSIWVFQWRKSVHYWWSYILFSPECKELTSMLDPLLYRWGVPPVVIRCVHWTMQMWVLQTWIKALGLYIVMCSISALNPSSVQVPSVFSLCPVACQGDSWSPFSNEGMCHQGGHWVMSNAHKNEGTMNSDHWWWTEIRSGISEMWIQTDGVSHNFHERNTKIYLLELAEHDTVIFSTTQHNYNEIYANTLDCTQYFQ